MSTLEQRRLSVLSGSDERPALVVVDVQRSFGDPEYLRDFDLSEEDLAEIDGAVTRTIDLVASARRLGVPVIWVELASDPERPWRSSSWLRFAERNHLSESEPCVIGTAGAEWFRVIPADGETRVTKRGYSGFLGTDLEHILRQGGVTWLTVVGLTTDCCVSATAEDAFQLDWPVLVAADASAAYDRQMHKNALEQLSTHVAAVTSAEEIEQIWRENREAR